MSAGPPHWWMDGRGADSADEFLRSGPLPDLRAVRAHLRAERLRHAELDRQILVKQYHLQTTQSEEWTMHMNPDREHLIAEHEEKFGYTHEQAVAAVDSYEKSAPLPQPKGIGRIIDSVGLAQINRDSVRRNYNRTLPDKLMERLDPGGTHVVGPMVIPHEHAQGKKVEPHIRAQFLIRTLDREEPVEAFLDMTLDHWQALPMIRKNEATGEYESVSPEDARETLLADIVEREG